MLFPTIFPSMDAPHAGCFLLGKPEEAGPIFPLAWHSNLGETIQDISARWAVRADRYKWGVVGGPYK